MTLRTVRHTLWVGVTMAFLLIALSAAGMA